MSRKQKIQNKGIRTLILVFGICVLLYGMQGQTGKRAALAFTRILSGVEFTLQKNAARLLFPGLLYTAKSPREGLKTEDPLITLAWELLPIYSFVYEREMYVTDIESGSVREQLLRKENVKEKERQELLEQMEAENQLAVQKQQELREEQALQEGEQELALEQAGETEQNLYGEEESVLFAGIDYSEEQLSDYAFVRDSFYTVANTTSIGPEVLDGAALAAMDLRIENDGTEPQILIYHTHSQEGFRDSVEGDMSTTIVGVGSRLTEILQTKYGYNVIHNTNVYDFINGKLDRNQAYSKALPEIQAILTQYPSIEVVIDLHRDGVDENMHLVTEIDGKPTARFMFFNGLSYSARNGPIAYLENPYIMENLAFSLQMKLACEKYYPGLARKNYLNSLRYNLHVLPRSLLVEAGAQTNTLEEMLNAMEPLADVLHKVIGNGN